MWCWSGGHHRGGLAAARAGSRTHAQCAVAGLGRWPALHLPARAQHRLAQELGRWRCDQSWRASGADGSQRRDGLSQRIECTDMGFRGRIHARSGTDAGATAGQLCDGERAVQDQLPAEFHGQTAVEAAVTLHQQLRAMERRVEDIAHIAIRTQEACIRIIDKQGPLHNPADRDHCVQYMVAIALLHGRLVAEGLRGRRCCRSAH